jgi:hypothetical protein
MEEVIGDVTAAWPKDKDVTVVMGTWLRSVAAA